MEMLWAANVMILKAQLKIGSNDGLRVCCLVAYHITKRQEFQMRTIQGP